jgi:hypothetical protein
VSRLVDELWQKVCELKSEADFYWPEFWKGDTTINLDKMLVILDQLRAFYVRMSDEYRVLLAMLPRISRWDAKAPQRFFTEFLSSRMKKTYGRPHDAIVAALAGVAFDLREGVDTETVRGRRRIGGPENSKQKAR